MQARRGDEVRQGIDRGVVDEVKTVTRAGRGSDDLIGVSWTLQRDGHKIEEYAMYWLSDLKWEHGGWAVPTEWMAALSSAEVAIYY